MELGYYGDGNGRRRASIHGVSSSSCMQFIVSLFIYFNFFLLQALFLITTKGIPDLKEPQKWSADFRSFVAMCLNKEVEDRPDAMALLKVSVFLFSSPLSLEKFEG